MLPHVVSNPFHVQPYFLIAQDPWVETVNAMSTGMKTPQGITYRNIGFTILTCGLIVVAFFLAAYDTTVGSGQYEVHNIGLIGNRQNGIMLGSVLAVVGSMLAFGSARNDPVFQAKKCPACGDGELDHRNTCRECGKTIIRRSDRRLWLAIAGVLVIIASLGVYLARTENERMEKKLQQTH